MADGHITIGGDVSATYGSDDPGFFDYTDYGYSALRMFRVSVTALVKANDHVAVLGNVETENFSSIRPYAVSAIGATNDLDCTGEPAKRRTIIQITTAATIKICETFMVLAALLR